MDSDSRRTTMAGYLWAKFEGASLPDFLGHFLSFDRLYSSIRRLQLSLIQLVGPNNHVFTRRLC